MQVRLRSHSRRAKSAKLPAGRATKKKTGKPGETRKTRKTRGDEGRRGKTREDEGDEEDEEDRQDYETIGNWRRKVTPPFYSYPMEAGSGNLESGDSRLLPAPRFPAATAPSEPQTKCAEKDYIPRKPATGSRRNVCRQPARMVSARSAIERP